MKKRGSKVKTKKSNSQKTYSKINKNVFLGIGVVILMFILFYAFFVPLKLEVVVTDLPAPPWATVIYGCQELNESGAYYVLNHSFVSFGDCFLITAPNITLDGEGNGIQGNDTGVGIQTNQPEVTIRDISVLHFDVGVYLQDGSVNSSIINSNIVYNDLQDIYDSYALTVQIKTDKDNYYSSEQVNLTDASQLA